MPDDEIQRFGSLAELARGSGAVVGRIRDEDPGGVSAHSVYAPYWNRTIFVSSTRIASFANAGRRSRPGAVARRPSSAGDGIPTPQPRVPDRGRSSGRRSPVIDFVETIPGEGRILSAS
jgi:hypothetical protein